MGFAVSILTEAIAWSGSGVMLSLFVLFPTEGGSTFAGPIGDLPPRGVKTYYLEAPDERLRGGECYEYDLLFDIVPANLESIVVAWLQAAIEAGADVCWFGYEGSFHFDDLLTADIADQVYAVGSRHGIELAIEDQTRSSERWAAKLPALKERVGR